MKILRIKLFQSVKVGTKEVMFIKETDKITAELLDRQMVHLKDDKGNSSVTSLYNCQYFVPAEEKDLEQFRMLPAPISIHKKKTKKTYGKNKE